MKHIGWGFIGCSNVPESETGIPFNDVRGSNVEAVFNDNIKLARTYANTNNIKKWYTDAQLLVNDKDVNAIYISTPSSSHATYAIMAMKAGKPCLIDKPLANSYDDCIRINRISEKTNIPCFVAYYRRKLPYFNKVKEIITTGTIGKILTVQVRFAVPAHDLTDNDNEHKLWRLQSDIIGGSYFYDLACHQLDILQNIFGVIIKAHGYIANRAGIIHDQPDTVNAVYRFENGLNGSGAWSFSSDESARTDRIEIFGTKGRISLSVYTYEPICLYTSDGVKKIKVANPKSVQFPLIKEVIEDLQGFGKCDCTSISGTPTNWVMDRILGKI